MRRLTGAPGWPGGLLRKSSALWTACGQTGIVEALRTTPSADSLTVSQEERHDTRRLSQSCPRLDPCHTRACSTYGATATSTRRNVQGVPGGWTLPGDPA